MNKQTILLILFLAMSTLSCFILTEESPNIKAYNLDVNDDLQEIWRKEDISIGSNSQRTNIIVDSGMLIVRGSMKTEVIGSSIFGLSSIDGKELWRISRTGGGQIAAQDSILYNSSPESAFLQAYALKTGSLLWQTQLGWTKGVLDVSTYGEKVFAFTSSSDFFELTQNGEIVNNFRSDHLIYAMVDGVVYMEDPLSIKAVDFISNNELWKVELNSSYTFAPIFSEEDIFLFTNINTSKIYSVNRQVGNINWVKDYNILSNLAVAPDRVYFLGVEGHLVSLDINSGDEIFNHQFSPLIDSSKNINRYYIALDIENNILIIYLGDSEQIIAYQLMGE